jgi:NAD(P)-dependent dehydrogenase (short-subunit alcohol dehydrogenase family)
MKIAIVTGNYQGLGKALSEHLPQLAYKQPDIIRSADFDISRPEQAERLIDTVIAKYGRLDLLVNNVGNYIEKNLFDMSSEEWHMMFDSNLHSAFYLMRKALPHLRQSQGRILNIGYAGMERLHPSINVAAYQIAKTGLLLLTRTLAKEEAKHGVLINMLSPGHMENTVDTSSMHKIPLGRVATLDEAVNACSFLIQSDYITGQNLELAGAWGL